MERLNALEYLKLNKWKRLLYNISSFFLGIPDWLVKKCLGVWSKIKGFFKAIADNFIDIGTTFKNGRWQTRVSYLVMGFGNICYGQPLRGILFLLMEIIFIVYMALPGIGGGFWLSKFSTLGTVDNSGVYVDPDTGIEVAIAGDNSFKILLYGILTILFIIAFIYTWRLNVKQCRICDEYHIRGKRVKSTKDDLRSLVDEQFHKTLLALPTLGIMIFTVVPIIFMVLVAFTNYTSSRNGTTNGLFTWVGFETFGKVIGIDGASGTNIIFGEVLLWTLVWAFFATFTNYFLGMLVAMLINKKGIRLKKWWRTVLVLSIAIPQFVSLLYVSQMFSYSGVINEWLLDLGIISAPIHFMDNSANPHVARATVIIINIWIGIPYLMLITTGILMNIPQDLYESAKIDGANGWQQYTKITLPYMLFVTGPYLLTSFTSNLNNFNVIYLLSGGSPVMPVSSGTGSVGYTDILITWLFKMTAENASEATYNMASVIGIIIFMIVSVISLVVYNVIPSMRNEEDYQ